MAMPISSPEVILLGATDLPQAPGPFRPDRMFSKSYASKSAFHSGVRKLPKPAPSMEASSSHSVDLTTAQVRRVKTLIKALEMEDIL